MYRFAYGMGRLWRRLVLGFYDGYHYTTHTRPGKPAWVGKDKHDE